MAMREIMDISAKTFEATPDDKKKEVFLSAVDNIEKNSSFQKLKKYRDDLDEEKKLQYYKAGDIVSAKGFMHRTTKMPITPGVLPFAPMISKSNIKSNLYEAASPLIRLGVSFGLLDAPEKLQEKELLKNIKKDAKNLNNDLWIFEKICIVVPELKAAYPIVKQIRPYAKWYEKNGVSLMQEKIRSRIIENTEQSLASELSSSELDVLKTNVKTK